MWEAVREKLCGEPTRDEAFLTDLIEDLMHAHAAEFIDRVERVAEECAHARDVIAHASLDGVAPTPAQERFWRLQRLLASN